MPGQAVRLYQFNERCSRVGASGGTTGACAEYGIRRPGVLLVLDPELGTDRTNSSRIAHLRRKKSGVVLEDVEERDVFPDAIRPIDVGPVDALKNLEEIRIIRGEGDIRRHRNAEN